MVWIYVPSTDTKNYIIGAIINNPHLLNRQYILKSIKDPQRRRIYKNHPHNYYHTLSSLPSSVIKNIQKWSENKDAVNFIKRVGDGGNFYEHLQGVFEDRGFRFEGGRDDFKDYFFSLIISPNSSKINIKVTIQNKVGRFTYSAKKILADDNNDIAILKIEDSKFPGLMEIPYGIGF